MKSLKVFGIVENKLLQSALEKVLKKNGHEVYFFEDYHNTEFIFHDVNSDLALYFPKEDLDQNCLVKFLSWIEKNKCEKEIFVVSDARFVDEKKGLWGVALPLNPVEFVKFLENLPIPS